MKGATCILSGICAIALFLAACGDEGGGTGQFVGKLINFADGKAAQVPVPGLTVKALSNETGELLPGKEAVSAADGTVVFEGLPAGKVGFLTVHSPSESVDTYQFNIDSDAQGELLWSVDLGTYQIAPGLAGYQQSAEKGAAAGGIYWVDAQGTEVPVGCSTIRGTFSAGTIRYFGDNDFPTKLLADDQVNGRDDVNPLNGYFLAGNLEPVGEAITVEALVDGQVIGSVRYFAYANSVSIGNIYAEDSSNPQPAGCE